MPSLGGGQLGSRVAADARRERDHARAQRKADRRAANDAAARRAKGWP